MIKSSVLCRGLAYAFILVLLAQQQLLHGAETIIGGASPSPDLALFPWGVPQYTDDTLNTCPRPDWVRAAGMDGGLWITNNDSYFGWQPALDDETNLATNRLLIQLDRTLVTSNLWIAVSASGDPDAVLLAGLYDIDLLSVADPIILHISDTTPWYTNRVDLAQLPTASILSLSTTNGLMRIFSTVLYLDGRSGATSPTSPVAMPFAIEETTTKVPPQAQSKNAAPLTLPAPRTRYVDATAGADSNDGTAAIRVPATAIGPKKTITAALAAASPGDTICVAAGTYPEKLQFGNLNMVLNGRVVLQ